MESALLGRLVDTYAAKREERLAADKIAKRLKTMEEDLKEQIIDELIASETGSAGGRKYTVKRNIKNKPKVADWPKFYKHILENGAFELLQKRVGEAAVDERVAEGVEIPGMDFYEVNSLTVSKNETSE